LKILFLHTFFLLLLKQKRLQSGTKSIAYQFVWKKKTPKESACIEIAGPKQEDNIKMELIVVNLERGFIWLRA
jgi:hypothetical protein